MSAKANYLMTIQSFLGPFTVKLRDISDKDFLALDYMRMKTNLTVGGTVISIQPMEEEGGDEVKTE